MKLPKIPPFYIFKRNNWYLLLITGIIGLASCTKSFLDVPVTQKEIAEEYISDITSAQEFLNGIYFLTARDVYDYKVVLYADIVADNTKPLSSTFTHHYRWAQIGNDAQQMEDNMNVFWLKGYNIIRSCNFLLEHIDQFGDETASIKGQALALRALVHYNLASVFAQPYKFTSNGSHPGIPYDTIYAQTQHIFRQSLDDVYSHIIYDFNRALQLIPGTIADQSVFNTNAIKALLSRIYLFKGDYTSAKALADHVIAAVPIMQSSDYPSKLFTSDDKESLFWFAPVVTSNASLTVFQGHYFSLDNNFAATLDLVNTVQTYVGDKRNAWFMLSGSNYQVKKFPQNAVQGIPYPGIAYYQTVIRSSEMYLTAAEIAAKLGQDNAARNYLDVIRQRAGLPQISSSTTGSSLLDSIYIERRKEFCFENLRMYDLQRLGKGVTRTDVVTGSPTTLTYPSNKAIAPIPYNDVNTFDLQQNPDY